jgi:hypothetical protein
LKEKEIGIQNNQEKQMKIMYGLIGKVLPDLHTRAFS